MVLSFSSVQDIYRCASYLIISENAAGYMKKKEEDRCRLDSTTTQGKQQKTTTTKATKTKQQQPRPAGESSRFNLCSDVFSICLFGVRGYPVVLLPGADLVLGLSA